MTGEGDFSYANDPELVEQFISWTIEAVEELKVIADDLSDSENKNSDVVTRIYDLTHNIKGMGSSFDFMLMTEVGGSLCNYIKKLADDAVVSKRAVQAHVRVFDVVLEHKIHGSGGEKGAALIARLNVIIDEVSNG